ncbi:hypothetical protein HDE_00378 [Halotydeus destructor]|nr:hypothetical protein HDE_00378 [Halotydeus destructor]
MNETTREAASLMVTDENDAVMAEISEYRDTLVLKGMAKYEKIYDRQMAKVFKKVELSKDEEMKLLQIKGDHLNSVKIKLHDRFDSVLHSDKIQEKLTELYDINSEIPDHLDIIEAVNDARVEALPKLQSIKKQVEDLTVPWVEGTKFVQGRIDEKKRNIIAKTEKLRAKLEKLNSILDEPFESMIVKLP